MQLILDVLTLSDWAADAAKKRALERLRRQLAADEDEFDGPPAQLRKRLLLLLLLTMTKEKKWKDYLTMEGIWRRDRRIPRCALLAPDLSPWAKLFSSKNDQSHSHLGWVLKMERSSQESTKWSDVGGAGWLAPPVVLV